jgi:hypothetical protein
LKGGWQKIMAKNIKYYGGERIFSLQKEKIVEISKIFSNPDFGKMSFIACI